MIPITIESLDIAQFAKNSVTRCWLTFAHDALGQPIQLPIIVMRGKRDGPTVGIVSALHGNEVNGIPVIHQLVEKINPSKLKGTLICVLVANVPAFKRHKRFIGRTDINHLMPGQPDGNLGEVYAYRLVNHVLRHFDYLIDLHAASFGRVNSLYVRADLSSAACREMAYLLRPQIILNSRTSDRTFRGTSMELGIPAITVEIGNPQVFQPQYILWTLIGIRRILVNLNLLPTRKFSASPETILCDSSVWLFADHGGLMTVLPDVTEIVEEGQVIARQTDIFGDVQKEYTAPFRGVVIGKSTNPIGQTGARIMHLGRLDEGSQQ